MPGTLYVVSTPIGNLSDLTPRAALMLAEADFVVAEDTRVTLKLLNHLGLKKQVISYNRHNAPARGGALIERVAAGESCALCSDAGTPAISDPGEFLVREAHRRGIPVVPVPGACAAVAALSASGQVTGRFVFEGFIAQNKRLRAARLEALGAETRTVIVYEAPHKLPDTLSQLAEALGDKRGVSVCRELTKLHEEIWQTTLGEAAARYAKTPPRGEFVLVIAGAAPVKAQPCTLKDIAAKARALQQKGCSASEAAKHAALGSGYGKSAVYRELQRTKEEEAQG